MDYKSNIWKLYLVKFFGSIELVISIFVLFLLLNKLSMTQVMILETVFMITVVVLEIPTGTFADKFGRKYSMALSGFLACIAFIMYGLGDSFIEFLIANIFIGATIAFYYGASSAFIYDTLIEIKEVKKFPKLIGRFNALSHFTWGFSALVGGYLALFTPYRTLFFITAGFFFLEMLFALWLKEPPLYKKTHYLKMLKKGVNYALSNIKIRNLVIYFGLFAALGHISYVVIQAYYGNPLFHKYAIAISMFLYFVMAGLGGIYSHRIMKVVNEKTLLFSLLLIASLSFLGLFFLGPIAGLFLLSIMSFVCGVRDPFIDNEIQINTPSNIRATVGSVLSMGKGINYVIFAPLIGYFMDLISIEFAFLIMGTALLIHFIYFAILWNRNN